MNKNELNEEKTEQTGGKDFIRTIISSDLESGKYEGEVVTRFPPEPNGYLHIGHAKSICLNFGIAEEEESRKCHLRFDDTNPSKEEDEYVQSIITDVKWLGFDWGEDLYYASDYFEKMYAFAIELIKAGKAYVCDLNAEQIRKYRGTLKDPGENSPYRDRSVDENLDLFQRMKAGEFEDGTHVLRAKIDMAAPNINLRDPVMYRILHATHHRTGDSWCIYPMYDWAHGLEDSLEKITHSICTLEFEDHRPVYDWFLDQLKAFHPTQIEFARLNLSYTIMSKRKLLQLVTENHVSGWDDPRMPTISGLRRRGYSPAAIRDFCDRIGVAKRDSLVDMALLEHCVREDLNKKAQRVMAVLDPVKLIIDNYPEDHVDELDAINNPEDESMGKRKVPFSKVLYIERDDFREDPPKKFFRLAPGREVRLRYAYYITCTHADKDPETGEITAIHCTYDPATKGGWSDDGRKVKATLHWVSAKHSIEGTVRKYDRLFTVENPNTKKEGKTFTDYLNPDSLSIEKGCKIEPWILNCKAGDQVQFERKGYFCADIKDYSKETPIFNQTVTLRDSWAKIAKKMKNGKK